MAGKEGRDAVAESNGFRIVEGRGDEGAEFWLLSPAGDEFPLGLGQLHDVMHTLHQLHDKAHHH